MWLACIQQEEAQQVRGKLKVFFGMAAGVDKTYAMLEAAQARRSEGVDIVAGRVDTHGRPETERLLHGLDAGADDYLTKPFGAGELLARIGVALRHAQRASVDSGETAFAIGHLRVDLARRQVWVGDDEVHLTPIEYRLLTTLVRHAGKVVTHRQLLREVWGSGYVEENHYVRVYMAQLRHKLESDPARPRYLLTEPGVGYRLAIE